MIENINNKMELEYQEDFFKYFNTCTEADKRLLYRVAEYENQGFFDEMLFKPKSLVSKFIESYHFSENGSEKLFYEDMEDRISIALNGYKFYVKELDVSGIIYPKERTVYINISAVENDSLILHEIIHVYEELLRNQYPFYHEILVISLYKYLQNEIPNLDDLLLNHMHACREVQNKRVAGYHSVLFLLKSLELDLRLGYELGTICGYDREELVMYYTDIALLKRKAATNGVTLETIAIESGIGTKVFNKRMQSGQFLIGEIQKICSYLKLSSSESEAIFMSRVEPQIIK